jgi:putative FmdB family regulatory protein
MPTYEYICGKCGHEFEAVQSISAKPLRTCPEDLCGQKKWGHGKVKRKISAGAGLLFKGSGFYITDYRSQKYKDAAKKDSAPAKTPAGETKPAAKPETKSAKAAAKT